MICVPITARTIEKALVDIEESNRLLNKIIQYKTMLELRFDYLDNIDSNGIEKLMESTTLPIIATNRNKKDSDGVHYFKGSEKERIEYLELAARLGAKIIDIEHSADSVLRNDLIDLIKALQTKSMISYHNFQKTPELSSVYQKLATFKTDYIKIAVMAKSKGDVLKTMEFRNKHPERLKVCLSMGALGVWDRKKLYYDSHFISYIGLRRGKESAPGQPFLKELIN